MAIKKNDLLDYDLIIYQNDDFFKFSIDSVLLAEFVNIKYRDKNLVDLCCGNAPLLMILANKNKSLNYYGIELQKEVYSLAQKSIKENKLSIQLINDDIKNMENYFKENSLDIITCNPPYFKVNTSSIVNSNSTKAIARHELKINLKEIINLAFRYLKTKGYFYLVHRSDRFMEVVDILKQYNFGIKRIRFAYKNKENNSCCVLYECVKDGHCETLVEKPLYIDEFERR